MRANIRYGLGTLWAMVRYRLHRMRIVPCRLFFS